MPEREAMEESLDDLIRGGINDMLEEAEPDLTYVADEGEDEIEEGDYDD